MLEQKEKGIHGAAPGSAIPIQLTVRYLQAGNGPVVEADARVREGTLSSVKAAVVASALAVGYDPRFLEVRVDVLANFTWYRGLKLDGGSAGIGFAVGVASAILGDKLQESTCLTGTIEKDGRVGPVGSIYYKLEGCHMIFPRSRSFSLQDKLHSTLSRMHRDTLPTYLRRRVWLRPTKQQQVTHFAWLTETERQTARIVEGLTASAR